MASSDRVPDLRDIPHDALEQRLFELATDALLVCSIDGEIRRANPAAAQLALGADAETLGGSLWDLVHPEDVAAVRSRLADPVEEGRPHLEEFRCRIMRPGGGVRWAEVRAAVDPTAGLCHLVARDITERDEDDAERLSRAFRDAPVGMAIVAPGGRFRRVNPALCGMLGLSEGELLGLRTFDVAARREDAERWPAARSESGFPGSFELEARLRGPGGTTVVALVSGTLVRDPAGEPLHYVCQFQDVTARVEAQEALEIQEAQLAEAQQLARLGSWEWDIDEDRVAWSDELHRIHGLRPEGGARSLAAHLERVHADDRARVARAIEEGVADGRPWGLDHRIVRPDGEVRMIHARGEVIAGAGGRAAVVRGTCQDVTESRRVEDALRATEQLFRRAFDDAPIGMALIDLEGRWLRLNRSLSQMLGRAEADLRTHALQDLSHPEDAELDPPLIRELLAGRRRSYAIEKRLVHADGRVLHVLAHVSLMHGDGERPLYFLVQLVDLSERRRAEAERRASEQRLQAIIDNAPALIFVKDLQQRYVLVNRRWEELLGVEAERAVGRTAAEILPPERAAHAHEDLDREVIRTGRPVEAQTVMPGLEGEEERELLVVKFPLSDSDGGTSGVCTIAADMTERRRAERERGELEQRLAQAQRLESVGQLAGGVAHDFNNLLSVILTCADFVLDQLPEQAPVREDVVEIARAADSAAALTRQLLMFSRREVVQPAVLDVGELALSLESLLARTLTERIALRIEVDSDLPKVLADRARLEQVLVNLAVNARDAMPDGGTLTIEARRSGDGVSVSVADEGVGMPPEVADRAFEPFFTTKAAGQGTGLGLATVHGIVTGSGGEIGIRSQPGRGTVVRFTLPGARGGAAPEVGEDPVAPARPAGRPRVLVVEDQDPVRRQAARILAAAGYEVREAAGAAEALDRWEPVDLLLTDVVMPGASGHELAQLLAERTPDLAVVFMSGHTEDVVVLDGAREGEIRFLPKPFTRDALLAAVAEALAVRHAEAAAAPGAAA